MICWRKFPSWRIWDQRESIFHLPSIHSLSPAGKHLGTIVTGEPTANCGFGDDGQTLYMTANDKLTRIRLKTRGVVGK